MKQLYKVIVHAVGTDCASFLYLPFVANCKKVKGPQPLVADFARLTQHIAIGSKGEAGPSACLKTTLNKQDGEAEDSQRD